MLSVLAASVCPPARAQGTFPGPPYADFTETVVIGSLSVTVHLPVANPGSLTPGGVSITSGGSTAAPAVEIQPGAISRWVQLAIEHGAAVSSPLFSANDSPEVREAKVQAITQGMLSLIREPERFHTVIQGCNCPSYRPDGTQPYPTLFPNTPPQPPDAPSINCNSIAPIAHNVGGALGLNPAGSVPNGGGPCTVPAPTFNDPPKTGGPLVCNGTLKNAGDGKWADCSGNVVGPFPDATNSNDPRYPGAARPDQPLCSCGVYTEHHAWPSLFDIGTTSPTPNGGPPLCSSGVSEAILDPNAAPAFSNPCKVTPESKAPSNGDPKFDPVCLGISCGNMPGPLPPDPGSLVPDKQLDPDGIYTPPIEPMPKEEVPVHYFASGQMASQAQSGTPGATASPATTCNPVESVSGFKQESWNDLRVGVSGGEFVFVRHYSSNPLDTGVPAGPDGDPVEKPAASDLLGAGWTSPVYARMLRYAASGDSPAVLQLIGLNPGQYTEFRNRNLRNADRWVAAGAATGWVERVNCAIPGPNPAPGNAVPTEYCLRYTIPGVGYVDFLDPEPVSLNSPERNRLQSLRGVIRRRVDTYGNCQLYQHIVPPDGQPARVATIYLNCRDQAAPLASSEAVVDFGYYLQAAAGATTPATVSPQALSGRLARVISSRVVHGASPSLVELGRVEYTYKHGADGLSGDVGTDGDLIQVVKYLRVDAAELAPYELRPIGPEYPYRTTVVQYRYHDGSGASVLEDGVSGVSVDGGAHQLKMVINAAQIESYAGSFVRGQQLVRLGSAVRDAALNNLRAAKVIYPTIPVSITNPGTRTELEYLYGHSVTARGNLNTAIGRVGQLNVRSLLPVQADPDGDPPTWTSFNVAEYDYLGLSSVAQVGLNGSTELGSSNYLKNTVALDRTVGPDGRRNYHRTASSGHQTAQDVGVYPGFDRFGRVARHSWVRPGFGMATPPNSTAARAIVDLEFTYDAASNPTSKRDARSLLGTGGLQSGGGRGWLYEYDGLDRLTLARRGVLAPPSNATGGTGVWASLAGATMPPSVTQSLPGSQKWVLDALGNFTSFGIEATRSASQPVPDVAAPIFIASNTQDRTHALNNELQSTTAIASPADLLGRFLAAPIAVPMGYKHDDAGNRVEMNNASDPDRKTILVYDAWNRLVRIERPPVAAPSSATPVTLAEYAYDGSHQRVLKKVYKDPATPPSSGTWGPSKLTERREFVYNAAWQAIVEIADGLVLPPTSSIPTARIDYKNRHIHQQFFGLRGLNDAVYRRSDEPEYFEPNTLVVDEQYDEEAGQVVAVYNSFSTNAPPEGIFEKSYFQLSDAQGSVVRTLSLGILDLSYSGPGGSKPSIPSGRVADEVEYEPYGRASRRVDLAADFDYSGVVDVADIFAFLSAWFANDPRADADLDGDKDVNDIFAYLSLWFSTANSASLGPADSVSDPSVGNPYGYCGYYFDTETYGLLGPHNGALYHVRHRVYDPAAGRWLSRDPAGFVDGMNLYGYVGGAATSATDEMGLWAGIDDAIAAGVGALVGIAVQAGIDLYHGEASSWQTYAAAGVGGAVGGVAALYTGGIAAGAAAGAGTNLTQQVLDWATGVGPDRSLSDRASELAVSTAAGAALGLISRAAGKLVPKSIKDLIEDFLANRAGRVGRIVFRAVFNDKPETRARPYSEFRGKLKPGVQANHMGQRAAFPSIPRGAGLSVPLRGGAGSPKGSPHYRFHESMEEFWSMFRGNPILPSPTVAEHNQAVFRALQRSGYLARDARDLVLQLAEQQLKHGFGPNSRVPVIPSRCQ